MASTVCYNENHWRYTQIAKTKGALLSLDAQGTIGESLTYRQHQRITVAEKKPVPFNPNSLAQFYQRCLYQDYASYWTIQTEATKRTYAALGVRHHLTGFQYWMKVMLTTLPGLTLGWHLDERAGSIAQDFSKNAYTGTIVGTSPLAGIIDLARSFDGIDDRIYRNNIPLNLKNCYSIEFFFNLQSLADKFFLTIGARPPASAEEFLEYNPGTATLLFANVSWDTLLGITPIALYRWYHLVLIHNGTNNKVKLFLDGSTEIDTTYAQDLSVTTAHLNLAYNIANNLFMNAYFDQLALYDHDISLIPNLIKEHSQRRHP